MAAATCAYEHRRIKHADACHVVGLYKIGFAFIVLLLFCIFSLTSIDEIHVMHHVFAALGFSAIIALFYFYLHYCTHQRIADSAAICSSVRDVGNSMENRILRAPPLVTLISCMDPVIEQSLQLNL